MNLMGNLKSSDAKLHCGHPMLIMDWGDCGLYRTVDRMVITTTLPCPNNLGTRHTSQAGYYHLFQALYKSS